MVNPGKITDRYRRFEERIGVGADEPWLRPPVTAAELARTEKRLGFRLPDDLVELLSIHNGLNLFDAHQWVPCLDHDEAGLAGMTASFHELLSAQLIADGLVDLVPGPRTLYVGAASQEGILYDPDGRTGTILYLDVLSSPSIIPLARDLATLIDGYIALAEAGHITVDDLGPNRSGPQDEGRDILVAHGVADPMWHGINSWLSWPGSSTFMAD